MKSSRLLAILLSVLVSVPVQAGGMFDADLSSGYYVSAVYMQPTTKFDNPYDPLLRTTGLKQEHKLEGAILRLGRYIFGFLAIELHQGFTVRTNPEENGEELDGIAEIASLSGMYARGNVSLYRENINLYALAGYSIAEISYAEIRSGASGYKNPEIVKDKGLSYGFGAELYGLPDTAISLEWMRYLDSDILTLKGFSIGLVHHFSFR